jgi:hypothetical protein
MRIQEIVNLINDLREDYNYSVDFAFVVSILEQNEDGDIEMSRMGATSYDIVELYEEAEEHIRGLVEKNFRETYPEMNFKVDEELRYIFASKDFPPHPLN